MKRYLKRLIACCIGLIVAVCVAYLCMALYYRNVFMLNTWINGLYCTGMSVEEVNRELVARTTPPANVTVIGYEKATWNPEEYKWELSLKDMGYAFDYRESIAPLFEEQDPYLWLDNISYDANHYYLPVVTYDEEKILAWWQQIAQTADTEDAFKLVYAEDSGYQLYDGIFNRLDVEAAYEVLMDAVVSGQRNVNLVDAGCYYNTPVTSEHFAIKELWQRIDHFQSNGPVYDFGDRQMRIDEPTMALFLVKEDADSCAPVLDDNGKLQIDAELVAEFVNGIAAESDTYGKVWDFDATRGEQITVQGGTYGTTLDCDYEIEWLMSYLEELLTEDIDTPRTQTTHKPEYIRDAYSHSYTSIGDTYIEVDMGMQKLYYYEKGVLRLETDVVTGNARRRMNTPEGVNFVYAKQKNRVLRGADYATPVKFWMPVKGSIGIHDANWRKEFGGEIYKTDGSHGCVNMPSDKMSELYDMVEIGTPVVMFYGENS